MATARAVRIEKTSILNELDDIEVSFMTKNDNMTLYYRESPKTYGLDKGSIRGFTFARVRVIPFPPNGEKWQSSQAGGVQPRCSRDGNELFFLDPDGRLKAVSIPEGDPRRAGEPKPLFSTGLTPSNALDQFAVVGDRSLLRLPGSTRAADSSPIQVLINWTSR